MATSDEQQKIIHASLNQAPIDQWSTREKLALATSVAKSGDQNWNSVSRSLKSFAEENRPADWFNAKFCAIQYRDMFEKAEVPKRKRERKERSDVETPQILIVKKLTSERIGELTKNIETKLADFCELKANLDKLKKGNYDDEFFNKISYYAREKTKRKHEQELVHQKWVAERETKILQMNRRHLKPIIKSQPVPITVIEPTSDTESKVKLVDNVPAKKDTAEAFALSERGPTLLSPLSHANTSQPSPKSPRQTFETNVLKMGDKDLSSSSHTLAENKEDVILDESEIILDITVNTDPKDSVEMKNTPLDEASSISEGSTQKEMAANVKKEIILEQENSNDTIEETFENVLVHGDRVETNVLHESKKELSKLGTKDGHEAASLSKSDNKMHSAKSCTEGSTSKEHLEIKDEEDSSFSVLEGNNSTLDASNISSLDTPKEKVRRRRRRSNKVANASVMQTRSTRSQSQIKSEESKDHSIKMETAKGPPRKRSNSADESTSVDNTISEESNDGKSSTNESAQPLLDLWSSVKNHTSAHYFSHHYFGENYRRIVYRQMDLYSIKRRIDNGQINSYSELKRDFKLMLANVYFTRQGRAYKAVLDLEGHINQLFAPFQQKISRPRERTPQTPEIKRKVTRRKTRGSISMDKSNSKKKN